MLNVVIPITSNIEKYYDFLNGIADAFDIQVCVGVSHKYYQELINRYQYIDNFKLFEFDNREGKEQMINAMQDYLENGSIMVLRKPISLKEFEKIIKSESDIVTCKKSRTTVKTFFFKIWQKITKVLLGVKTYAGDFSMVYFNDDIADVVMRTGNLSYSSRVNRWKGIRQGVITTDAPADKLEKDHALNVKYLLFAIALFAVGAVVTAIVSIFVKMTIIIGLFLFCLDAICASIGGILLIMMIFTNMTGKKQYGKAIIMNKINCGEDL